MLITIPNIAPVDELDIGNFGFPSIGGTEKCFIGAWFDDRIGDLRIGNQISAITERSLGPWVILRNESGEAGNGRENGWIS